MKVGKNIDHGLRRVARLLLQDHDGAVEGVQALLVVAQSRLIVGLLLLAERRSLLDVLGPACEDASALSKLNLWRLVKLIKIK